MTKSEALRRSRLKSLIDNRARCRYHAACCSARRAGQRPFFPMKRASLEHGVIAQLGERYNGIVEVGGSIPPGSTKLQVFLRSR